MSYGFDLIRAAEKQHARKFGCMDIVYDGECRLTEGLENLYPNHPREFHWEDVSPDADCHDLLNKELKKLGIKEKVKGCVWLSN
jgi:hypothetical protein